MYKKLFIALALSAMAALNSYAQQDKKTGWQVELKSLALDLSSTEVKHAQEYEEFPNAKLNSDSQRLIQGRLHLAGDYFGKNYLWSNALFMEYGKNTIKPVQGEKLTTENADRILLSSDYTLRLWNVKNSPLKKVLRGSAGAKLFEGKYLKTLFASGFMEYDFTYPQESTKYGYEAGIGLEYDIREGVKAKFSGTFRDYCHESEKQTTDLDYSLELDARLDVLVLKNLSVAPFINYYTAQGKYVGPRGENLYVGVSFSFSHMFLAAK